MIRCVRMTTTDRTEQMRQIMEEVTNLVASPLYDERIANMVYPVIGEGSHEAGIMFIGEAPGKNEAATGRPFCGASGRILDRLLGDVELARKDVYITNVVKDRPPGNRDPKPDEIALYGPFLDRQIDIIKPKVIAPLGRFSMVYIMKKFGLDEKLDSISKIHGQAFEASTDWGTITIVPLYHPAVAVYNANKYGDLLNDFKKLLDYVA